MNDVQLYFPTYRDMFLSQPVTCFPARKYWENLRGYETSGFNPGQSTRGIVQFPRCLREPPTMGYNNGLVYGHSHKPRIVRVRCTFYQAVPSCTGLEDPVRSGHGGITHNIVIPGTTPVRTLQVRFGRSLLQWIVGM